MLHRLAAASLLVAAAAVALHALLRWPALLSELVFLHRFSWVFPPCDLSRPARPALAGFPSLSRWLRLHPGLPSTTSVRIPGPPAELCAWHTTPDAACAPAMRSERWVLLLHGNGESRCWGKTATKVELLTSAPICAHVVSIDYRGYGDSDGTPTPHGLALDVSRAWTWMRRQARRRGLAAHFPKLNTHPA